MACDVQKVDCEECEVVSRWMKLNRQAKMEQPLFWMHKQRGNRERKPADEYL
jgi:hypothetical protein